MPFRKSFPWGRTKPPVGYGLDWGDSINYQRAFTAMLNESAGSPRDLIKRGVGALGTGAVWAPNARGVGLRGTTTAAAAEWSPTLLTSDGAGGGDFTVFCISNPISEAAQRTQFGQSQAASPFALGLVIANITGATLGVSAGRMCFLTYNSAASYVEVDGFVDGKMHAWCGVRSGTNLSLYIDGVLRAGPTSATLRNIYNSAGFIDFGRQLSNGWYSNADFVIGSAWNRALTATEAMRLFTEPFAGIITPRRRIISSSASIFAPYFYRQHIAGGMHGESA